MNTKLKSLITLALPVVCACVSQVPDFPVTVVQQQQLQAIYSDAELRVENLSPVNRETVASLLQGYDRDVQAVLNAEQWANYDGFQRDYWVRVIMANSRVASPNRSLDMLPGALRSLTPIPEAPEGYPDEPAM